MLGTIEHLVPHCHTPFLPPRSRLPLDADEARFYVYASGTCREMSNNRTVVEASLADVGFARRNIPKNVRGARDERRGPRGVESGEPSETGRRPSSAR